ncbi:PP2C family protein-serine/threonine phosphatase [Streptantibioticus cattleyicolor]|uniref:Serine phosphatase RsbU regulator of sigma subunit-like protein n=1 Tax=Streptantibioticus cattleyicolor (strain ATCC 35852 / DSM 46488 / JCM 4925 / NBRC 14057 / NRRL 8057) TaxID=1003195 RepID=G8XFM0_STREN|nr:PP2C family protein-serine/threonine phosphatase [Streptantibioticus cattleyicolor]AEW99481.1 Serine phosphatase RsbU regulator of sigma subunit-like protein [Streptantibioticus cattleyicolor NRRL 8057 = DSM 46488]
MRWPGRRVDGAAGPGIGAPARPAWIRWLPALYVAAVLALEPVTPVQWPVSFLLIALPVAAAFAHGPVTVAALTLFAIGFQALLAGTPCCAGRSVGYVGERHYVAAYISTALVGVLGTILAAHQERRERTLATVRSVAETAQRVLLRPVPGRLGRIAVETLYLSAAAEARIGGDLYEAVPTAYGVRLLIGDVRGKGLVAVETAALLLGAFREAAHDEPDLARVAHRAERSMRRRAAQLPGSDVAERFVTAVFAEVPDDEPVVRIVNCGHPPPLLISGGSVTELHSTDPAPPLNLGVLFGDDYQVDTEPFRAGDQLLLYTDGVTETRDRAGAFYPLLERVGRWTALPPRELLDRLHEDLLTYSEARLDDDTAALAAYRLPEEPGGPPHPHGDRPAGQN